jgi:hypothetical protein
MPAEQLPVPERAGAAASTLDEPTTNEPAVLVIARVVPAAEDISGSAGDAEPIEITPEEKATLATLISQAAMADGFKGKGYVRAWLQTHYKIDVSNVAEIPRQIRAQVRAHAVSVRERRAPGAPRKTPAATTP